MEVILEHFSHEHPLVLVNELSSEKLLENLVCYCCQEPITSAAYSCEHCSYYLHKKCGELPHGVIHPMHPQHPLTLRPHPLHGFTCSCDVCGKGEWKWFAYTCADCNFDAHVSCTPLVERPTEHKFHNHSLTFSRRKATFFCDACGTEGEDLSYRCSNTSCEFWIHDTCASTPNTIKRNDHAHSLQLSYSIPHPKRKFDHNCYICRKRVHINYWVYYCSSCTYLAHLKCAKSEETTDLSDALSVENEASDLVYVPTPGLTNMMSQFSIDTPVGDDDNMRIGCWNDHFSWIDDDVDCIKKMKKKDVLCDVCVQPIIFFSEPFSKCGECSFIAHKKCTFLISEILHPSHLHPLTLYRVKKGYHATWCSICGGGTNGMFYKCETCTDDYFCIDFSCATTCLPNKIKHKAHHHPFILQPFVSTGRHQFCRACGKIINYGLEYICVSTTCDFHLHTNCAMLPGTVEHDWDKHTMSLTYPPFDHPEDYICETCEEYMHPTLWLYHCSKCDHSFHTNCQHRHDWFSKFKFGMTYKFEGHQHNLTSCWKPDNSHPCDCCGICYGDIPLLDCTSPSCTYQMCSVCAIHAESQRIEFPDEE